MVAPFPTRDRFFTCEAGVAQWASSLDSETFYFTAGGRIIEDIQKFICENAEAAVAVEVQGRLRGGKGGFGSMLRSFRVNRSTNQLMCRDLNGRRMATVAEENKLKKWVEKAAEREKQKQEKRRIKIEKLKGGTGKHQFNDPDYIQQREDILEKTEEAFEHGFENFKKIRENEKKKEAAESSDSDLDLDDFGQNLGRKRKGKAGGHASEKKQKLDEGEDSDSSDDSENECDPELIKEIQQYFEEKKKEGGEKDEPCCSRTEETKEKEPPVAELPKTPEAFEDIDLKTFESQEELEKLGLGQLKHALTERGLKCGGSLKERADRLFAVRDLHPSKYPKNLRAAAKK